MDSNTDIEFVPGKRINLGKIKPAIDKPNQIAAQLDSYQRFLDERLPALFAEISPIDDNTGKLWRLELGELELRGPKRSEEEVREKKLSYTAPLYIKSRLINKKTGEVKSQKLFVGEIPFMTPRGTFYISGNERAVVMQIVRSEGVIFMPSKSISPTRNLFMSQLMPARGAWITYDINKAGVITVKLAPRRPKILFTTLLRALGYSSDAEIYSLFEDIDTDADLEMIEATLAKDKTKSFPEATFEIYSKLRPDISATLETATAYIHNALFDPKRFFLGNVGRYQLNRKLEEKYTVKNTEKNQALRKEDLVAIGRSLILVNTGQKDPDDIDHLANRRIRRVDELLAEHLQNSFARVEKGVRDKMSIKGPREKFGPADILNSKPILHAFNEFFGTSAVSRYMNQLNVAAELANKREITAGGPGGLSKERATFSVRDVHYSHYSRICPVETPDGPSIGVVTHLALYARINENGFIEAPFRKVYSELDLSDKKHKKILVNRIADQTVKTKRGRTVVKKGDLITKEIAREIAKTEETMHVKAYVSDEVEYLTAGDETDKVMAPAGIEMDEHNNIMENTVPARRNERFTTQPAERVEYMDVDPAQISGSSFALVSLAENSDPHRTLLSASMVRQALPLVYPESPLVGTGNEGYMAKQTGFCVYAERPGKVDHVDADQIVIKENNRSQKREYDLKSFMRTNDNTSITQTPAVKVGQAVKKDQLLANGPSVEDGELGIGTNIRTAIMFYDGYNFEDGFVVSERVIANDKFTNVLIHEYSQEVRETKLGPEEMTNDIPNVSEGSLGNLDKDGVIRVGAQVKANDILVGIVAPKGEYELTAEERLLRAIFGEQARDVRDTSLRVPHGQNGVVVGTQILSRDDGDQLSTGTLKLVRVWVAKLHRLNLGDKLSDIHAQKGVVCKVLPLEDMPYTADGEPVDVVLNPMFLKRMNIGLLKEMWWGRIAEALGVKLSIPQFTPLDEDATKKELEKRGIEIKEKVPLYDGRTGEKFDSDIVVGPKYYLKLHHIAEEKVHARSTGPYAIVTQQPLGGKAQFGGQRLGEMEVWALEAHRAAYTLQEMLTIKSDDVRGRSKAYDAIVHGEAVDPVGVPEVLRVFITELRSLMLNPQPMKFECQTDKEEPAKRFFQKRSERDKDENKEKEKSKRSEDPAKRGKKAKKNIKE